MSSNDKLPVGWAVVPLGDLLSKIETGKSFKCDERPPLPSEVGVVKVSAVSWGEYQELESKTCENVERINPSLFVQRGDFLFSRANTIELVGACVIATQASLRVMLSDKILRFHFSSEAMKPWALHLLRSQDGRRQIETLASGNQDSMRNIGQSRIKQICIPLPPSAEQTRIVEKLEELLSDLDAGVAELKAAQRKLAQYRQSLLKTAVKGALTADWRAARANTTAPQETGAELLQRILTERRASWEVEQLAKFAEQERTLPKGWRNKYKAPLAPPASAKLFIPSEWAWTGIEQLAGGARHALKAGPFGSALKKEFYTSTGYKIYGQEQVINGDAHFGNYFISSEKYAELISCAIKPGDLLISLVGTTGKILVLPPDAMPGIINPRLLKVSLSAGNIVPAYIQIVLESPYARHFFKLNAHGGTMDVLNLGILKELAIPIPSMAEQEEIVQRVHGGFENIARQSSAIEYALKQSAAQRKNILKAAFAGQLVPQDPNDEPASALLQRILAERDNLAEASAQSRRTKPKKSLEHNA